MAGLFCCAWLVFFGIFAKVGAFFASIPNCVLGGMLTYLVGNVIVSGLNILCLEPATRRNRIILSLALCLGIGVEIMPQFFSLLWVVSEDASPVIRGLRDGITATLQNGVSLGALTGLIMNLLLPASTPEELQRSKTFGDNLRSMSIQLTTTLSMQRSRFVAPVLSYDSKFVCEDIPEDTDRESDNSSNLPPGVKVVDKSAEDNGASEKRENESAASRTANTSI